MVLVGTGDEEGQALLLVHGELSDRGGGLATDGAGRQRTHHLIVRQPLGGAEPAHRCTAKWHSLRVLHLCSCTDEAA